MGGPDGALHALEGDPAQPIGAVLQAAAAPEGGWDLLACLHLDLALSKGLRMGSADGPLLEMLELPYALAARR